MRFGGGESVRLGFLAAKGGELRGEVAAVAVVVVVVVGGCLLGLFVVVHVDVGSGVVVVIIFIFVRVLIVDVFIVFIGPVIVLGRFALHPREVIRVQALHAIVVVVVVLVVVFRVFFCVWVLGAGPGFLHRLA